MCLHAQPLAPVPEETSRVAHAAFPKGHPYLQLRERLGVLYDDARFVALFPPLGQPAEAPWRLALVSALQFAEDLSDRQAADAVRARIDWKYLLGLELTDAGFDYSVLSEFRSRLWQQRLERARYEADRAGRAYRLVEPENRLVARQLEREWEEKLAAHERLELDHRRAPETQPRTLSAAQDAAIRHLAADIPALWQAGTTTPAERKEIIRQLVHRVVVAVQVQIAGSAGKAPAADGTSLKGSRRCRLTNQASTRTQASGRCERPDASSKLGRCRLLG
jgi:transposase